MNNIHIYVVIYTENRIKNLESKRGKKEEKGKIKSLESKIGENGSEDPKIYLSLIESSVITSIYLG